MIDHNRTFIEFGYKPDDLSRGSARKVVAVCDGCGEVRDVEYKGYRDVCNACAMKKRFVDDLTIGSRQGASLRQRHIDDPTLSQTLSDAANRRWADPEARIAESARMVQYYIDHPEAVEKARDVAIEQWADPTAREIQSETLKASDLMHIESDRQRGGDDIVEHHFIYDHQNPSNHTVQITRSEHTAHHHWMNRAGLEVPHININNTMEV